MVNGVIDVYLKKLTYTGDFSNRITFNWTIIPGWRVEYETGSQRGALTISSHIQQARVRVIVSLETTKKDCNILPISFHKKDQRMI